MKVGGNKQVLNKDQTENNKAHTLAYVGGNEAYDGNNYTFIDNKYTKE